MENRVTWRNSWNNGWLSVTTCWQLCILLWKLPTLWGLEYKMEMQTGLGTEACQDLSWLLATGDISSLRVLIAGRFSQHSLVAWSSLCTAEASWSFPCPLWNICYCICLLVWGDTSSMVDPWWQGTWKARETGDMTFAVRRQEAGTSRGVTMRPSPGAASSNKTPYPEGSTTFPNTASCYWMFNHMGRIVDNLEVYLML